MVLDLFLIWYLVVGFLLGNGAPHFTYGAASKVFRSPFGQRSSPRTNILWGISNFVAATVISFALAVFGFYDGYSIVVLLLGFWLAMVMFGFGIKRFLND
ncbi:MAG TPA: hypothetical protein VLU91_08910 [Nitrososphaerales archaeon]|nr:hypothetical protein [Nitrososphaerales archaeon]